MDNALVYGANEVQHNADLQAVMNRLEAAGVTTKTSASLGKTVNYLGHLIDQEGIRADPEKTSSILQMEAPTNVTKVRRFLSIVTSWGNSPLESWNCPNLLENY